MDDKYGTFGDGNYIEHPPSDGKTRAGDAGAVLSGPTPEMVSVAVMAMYEASHGDFDATPDEAAAICRAILAAAKQPKQPQVHLAANGHQAVDGGEAERDAAHDVLAERERQKAVEGWTPEHDDEHNNNELALAASCYAHPSPRCTVYAGDTRRIPTDWPWDVTDWRPKDKRRNLVRAGALILAEIERLDRAAMNPTTAKE